MPELPEVEITRRGIEPFLSGNTVTGVAVRNRSLRWPIPEGIERRLRGSRIAAVSRRGKYILVECTDAAPGGRSAARRRGCLILHLGMSGSLRIVDKTAPPQKHDHFDLIIGNQAMRLRDPRRFGAVLWESGDISRHPLLAGLGAEPLETTFTGNVLHQATRGRKVAIKLLLMNAAVVVGVGNIYANESLFHAGIHPRRQAGRLSLERCGNLVATVKATLHKALAAGGSSLRDFVHSDGASGYFQQQYMVYDRGGEACRVCGGVIRAIRQGQRSTFYCPNCQT